MFVSREDLIENPGKALKGFANKMMIAIELLTAICIVIAVVVAVNIGIGEGGIEKIAFATVCGMFIIAQQTFMVTTYGVLYGIGVLIENNQKKASLLEHKNKYDGCHQKTRKDIDTSEDDLPML